MRFNIAILCENISEVLNQLESSVSYRKIEGENFSHFFLESRKSFLEVLEILKCSRGKFFVADRAGNQKATYGFPEWVRYIEKSAYLVEQASTQDILQLQIFGFNVDGSVVCEGLKKDIEYYCTQLTGRPKINWTRYWCSFQDELSAIGVFTGEKETTISGKTICSDIMDFMVKYKIDKPWVQVTWTRIEKDEKGSSPGGGNHNE